MHENGIGWAVKQLQDGFRVARPGWNGKGMWLCLWPGYPEGTTIDPVDAKAMGLPKGTVCKFLPYIMMRTVQGDFVPWLASQTDILAVDWGLAE